MNLLLMQAGFPPAIIRKEDRKQYIASIEKAQRGGSLADYYTLMYAAIDRSLDFYLDTLEGREQAKKLEQKPLLKIGELAKLVAASAPTIRHWTKAGLLHAAEYTKSGYQLYNQDQVAVVKKIRTLQNKDRLTIAEIKQALTRIS